MKKKTQSKKRTKKKSDHIIIVNEFMKYLRACELEGVENDDVACMTFQIIGGMVLLKEPSVFFEMVDEIIEKNKQSLPKKLQKILNQ